MLSLTTEDDVVTLENNWLGKSLKCKHKVIVSAFQQAHSYMKTCTQMFMIGWVILNAHQWMNTYQLTGSLFI